MTEDLQRAIELVTKLFDERDGADWWSANIIEASRHLKEQNDWSPFYSYLANPECFDPNAKLEVIDDKMKIDFQYPRTVMHHHIYISAYIYIWEIVYNRKCVLQHIYTFLQWSSLIRRRRRRKILLHHIYTF